jgi:enoyl-CoA hydratase
MSVELTRHEEFGLLKLSRPEKLNALSFDVLRLIGSSVETASSWPIRALLITGEGERPFARARILKNYAVALLRIKSGAPNLGSRSSVRSAN